MHQDHIITMTTKEARRYEIVRRLIDKKIDGTEASKLLRLCLRQVQRVKVAVLVHGLKGIPHGNRGKPSNRKIDDEIMKKAIGLLHSDYHDFNPLLAQEKLSELHAITIGTETVRQFMIKEQLWKPRCRGETKKHAWRERKDTYGEMEQFDGSYHNWFEGRNEAEIGTEQCLLVAVDDASGKLTGVAFAANEGIEAVFGFWKEYFIAKGLPLAIYLDKFSTYKVNHANAVDNKDFMTQFERAMQQLDVRVIHANTPQAKGRVEKMNGTLQRRLVKELRLAKIDTIAKANIFLKDVFIPKFNAKFAVATKKDTDLHRTLNVKQTEELNSILSIQSDRVICNDYTVRFKNSYYQLKEVQPTTVYKRSKVLIEERLNGELKICVRGKYLNYFTLPHRPKKEIDVKLAALTLKKSAHTPSPNHPWRRRMNAEFERKKYYVSTQVSTNS